MSPTIPQAESELTAAGEMNPGRWTDHSRNVAEAARLIADACPGMDADKAYVLGLMHDIGRRTGIAQVRHIVDGYNYCMSRGWGDCARICLTHSYPVKDIRADIGKFDITDEQYEFVKKYLENIEYDDYDRLIILCDALGDADGFCVLEKRFVDTTRRYGVHPCTVDRWNATFEIKEHFEGMSGRNVYSLLPGIEKCLYR